MTSQHTFFDYLNGDLRSIVARYTSRRPRSENWRKEIGQTTLQMFIHPESPFERDIGLLFPVIMIDSEAVHFSDDTLRRALREKDVFKIPKESRSTERALRSIGLSLQVLFIQLYIRDAGREERLYRQVMQYCRNIRGLCLFIHSTSDTSWPSLLSQLAPTLEMLSLYNVNAAIMELELDLKFPRLNSLGVGFTTSWSLETEAQMNFKHIFRVMGETVEVLLLDGDGIMGEIGENVCQGIRQYCPRLRNIQTRNHFSSILARAYSELLCTYEHLLQQADFSPIIGDMELCSLVLDHCPNVRSSLRIDFDSGFESAFAKHCGDLSRLHLVLWDYFPVDVVRFFDSLSSSLDVLEMSLDVLTDEMMRKMCASLTRVRKLFIESRKVNDMDSLVKLFSASKCLEDAHVKLRHPINPTDFISGQAEAVNCVKKLLEVMSYQRFLKKLFIEFGGNDFNELYLFRGPIDNAVQPFRLRSTEVHVCGIDYFSFYE